MNESGELQIIDRDRLYGFRRISPKQPTSAEVAQSNDMIQRMLEGAAEGISREIERRAKAGEPIVIQRNGRIETIWPVDGKFPDDIDDDDDDLAKDQG